MAKSVFGQYIVKDERVPSQIVPIDVVEDDEDSLGRQAQLVLEVAVHADAIGPILVRRNVANAVECDQGTGLGGATKSDQLVGDETDLWHVQCSVHWPHCTSTTYHDHVRGLVQQFGNQFGGFLIEIGGYLRQSQIGSYFQLRHCFAVTIVRVARDDE